MGFFDVAARLCAGDGPIAALVGRSSCIALHYNTVHLTSTVPKNENTTALSNNVHESIRYATR